MVRLVFRPYTHVRRTICTSVSLRASITVSSDFTLHKHSSPSFGSQHGCSCSATGRTRVARPAVRPFLPGLGQYSVSLRVGVCHPNTRTHVRLLGPCFKTGRINPAKTARSWVRGVGEDAGRTGARISSTRGPPGSCHVRGRFAARLVAGPGSIVPASGGARPPRQSRIDSLASNDFTYYFTFFSKSFSPFPHGTCPLSVSRK